MIDRYTRPTMGAVWSTERKFETWLRVEIAVAEAWAEEGRIPVAALPSIRAARFDAARIAEIENRTQHDVIAFLTNLAETVGDDARWIHLGLTSSDVVDTALALQLVEAADLILAGALDLRDALAECARTYRHTVMMGRTHNVHAEPITFGYKVAVWYAEIERHLGRLQNARAEIAVAKIAGAVGTHANVPASIEETVAARLGLVPEPAATQVVQRDRHAAFVLELCLLASSLDRIATELRNLQHTEILEVEEPFRPGQQGSSAMPHKRNPILNERISGLARIMRGYAVPALENVVLWHERDISNSSVERIMLPGACILTDYMLATLTRIVRDMRVDEARMRHNMDLSRHLFFSEKVLTALVEAGLPRQDAYLVVQRSAMRAWDSEDDFRDLILKDPDIAAHLTPADLSRAFDLNAYLAGIDVAFQRLGL